uniref:Myotubularin-related protein 2 (Trinotate prediction) n=1 Tax=Henneguya salminicola TaxID=69463 RepID=A0A6G3MEM2_HENSL
MFENENENCKKLHDELIKIIFPISNKATHPAFLFNEKFKNDGWEIYNPVAEFERMGIPNDLWRITNSNENFSLCPTYPKILAIPKNVTDETLNLIKKFRSKARIPVLSWVHPKNQCSITRCSQPQTGATKRNEDDENYILSIIKASPSCHKLIILDARPKINAVSNQAIGGGYEDAKHYSDAALLFLDIANIHSMRDSYNKLRELCMNKYNSSTWYSELQNTKWLDHVGKILSGAVKLAENVDRNRTSVVVHCSDGWDRTSQLTSLAMICLDPFYRSVIGFETLIEKEWCSFGHKFGQRYGIGDKNSADEERSPVFNQFLDCVWQILNQYPCAFEFTENLLLEIIQHMNSGLYGTFIFDNLCLREQNV